jgi:hypothetical protein
MKVDVYVEDKGFVGDASYRYRATALLPAEVSRARAVFRGHSDVSGAHAYRELLTGLLDLKLVDGEHDLTVVHDDDAQTAGRKTRAQLRGPIPNEPPARPSARRRNLGRRTATPPSRSPPSGRPS